MVDHISVSQYILGAVMQGSVNPNRVRAETLYPPYDRGFKVWQDRNEVVKAIGIDHYEAAQHAVVALNGSGQNEKIATCSFCGTKNIPHEKCSGCGANATAIDWVKILEEEYAKSVLAEKLKRAYDNIKKGREFRPEDIAGSLAEFQQGTTDSLTPLSKVTVEETQWKRTGIKFLDYFNGGVPTVGLVNIAGRPKVGKTTLVIEIAVCMAREHPEENFVVFTLEMTNSQFKNRALTIFPDLTEDVLDRILVADKYHTATQSIAVAAGVENLGGVVIDFADLMIMGNVGEQETADLYKVLAHGAKKLNTPIILLSQLSRKYEGGIPRPNMVRYSSLAEALSVMNIMLYVGWNDSFPLMDENTLPVTPGKGWVIRWFSRFPTRKYPNLPLAIEVDFDGKTGWDINQEGRPITLEK